MKKLAFCLSLLLLFSCSRKNDFRIEGELEHGNGRVLCLSVLTADGLLPVDSVVLRRNAFHFSISSKNIEQLMGSDDPTFFQLSLNDDNALTTLAHKGNTVRITADADKLISSYHVDGPEDALLMWQLDSALGKFAQYTDTLLCVYQYYMAYDSARRGVERYYNRAVKLHTQYLCDFIHSHPHSLSSMIAFYQKYGKLHFFDEKEDADLLRMLTDSLSMNYPNSQYVKYLQMRVR